MTILIVEDDKDKMSEIRSYLISIGVNESDVAVADTMTSFVEKFDGRVAMCIIDLRIPAYEDGPPDINGLGIVKAAEKIGKGKVKLLGISSHPEEFDRTRSHFESRGCMLVSFDERAVWQAIVKNMVVEMNAQLKLDFVIFCALREERSPFTGMASLGGHPVFESNLSRYDIRIGENTGTIVELPRMGLVDASITAATCIERFSPRVVAMSGICAGFSGRAELGQLLVSELAYEYQSGKWTSDGFSAEPYQSPVHENVKNILNEVLDSDDLLVELEEGWRGTRPQAMSRPKLAAFTSGSAVLASADLMAQVSTYHRRVQGLDMEVYGIHRAAQIARSKPDFFCAKTVVDLADGDKNDRIHSYGSYISARFTIKALKSYFNREAM